MILTLLLCTATLLPIASASAQEAEDWLVELTKRAEGGDALAQFRLGLMYVSGRDGFPQSYSKAAVWYRRAADGSSADAQCNLGVMYEDGQGVDQDYVEAAKLYLRAAMQNHAGAQNNLGLMYELGRGVRQDYAEARRWFRKSAVQGQVWGQYNLARIYYNGDGVPVNYAEADHWFHKAAEQNLGLAQYIIARDYYNGYGMALGKKGHTLALKYLEKFTDQFRQPDGKIVVENADMKAVMSDALRMLQALYRFGRGTAVDVEKANRLLEEAAQFGDPDAAAIARALRDVNTLGR